jgi:hypothetical protein
MDHKTIELEMEKLWEACTKNCKPPSVLGWNGIWLSSNHPGQVSYDCYDWFEPGPYELEILKPLLDAYREANAICPLQAL